jgi:serine/threonine-protein kinase
VALEAADETLGRYRLFARLGRGGMAELHLARLAGIAGVEKFVVIKRMLGHLADDPQFVQMFENEGRIAVRLDHPNVCQTYELGNVDGQLFLVMELVRGLPWSTVVNRLPSDELSACRFIVGVMTQACEGLHYAHHLTDAAGNPSPVVHRDVTPGNLMITNEGAIKLLDFGVSKLLNDEHSTRAGMIKGKLPYMSPEHIRGEAVDPRTDIFSLAVMVWEALAKRSLFDRPSDLKIFKAIVEDPIPPLPQTPLTKRIEIVLQRALAKDKNHRQATARQLADELRDAVAPAGLPMTQAQIQRALSEWLAAELASANQDLAGAINRVRAADAPRGRPTSEPTRTSIDFVTGRAAETQVGDLASAGVEADTEDEQATTAGVGDTEDEQSTAFARTRSGTADEAPTAFAGGARNRSGTADEGPTAFAGGARNRGNDDERPTLALDLQSPQQRTTLDLGGHTRVDDEERATMTAGSRTPMPRMPSEPSGVSSAPTAPRSVIGSSPVFNETDEPSGVSGAPTAPRRLPLQAPTTASHPAESAPTSKFELGTPHAHTPGPYTAGGHVPTHTPSPQTMPYVPHTPAPSHHGAALHAQSLPQSLPHTPPPGPPGVSGGAVNAAVSPGPAGGWQMPPAGSVAPVGAAAPADPSYRFWVIAVVVVSIAVGMITAIALN